MKRTILILSFCLSACGNPPKFPDVPVYIADVKNNVCAEYKLVDQINIKFKLVKEHPLDKCQDVVGFNKKGFKTVQNWARDEIAEKCK